MTPRKLLFVSAQPCPAGLLAHLRARSWELLRAKNLKAARLVLRQQHVLVGLLVLDSPQREVPADFEACREASDPCEWVGVVPRGALDHPALRDMVLRHLFDHHTHPADPAFLCQSLGHAYGRALLRAGAGEAGEGEELGLTCRSATMQQLRRLLRKAGPTGATVLVEGESGSGKTTVARALHACSARAAGPFVALNCAALAGEPPRLFDSAAGGTLFLDNVAEMPLQWQPRLLRFMAEKTILRGKLGSEYLEDTRVIAATETPLAEAVIAKRFRQDLCYRLTALQIAVPPLRERKEDIAALARQFHARCLREFPGGPRGFSREALAALAAHGWPGNVRELFNRVQRAVLLAERRMIASQDLGLPPGQAPRPLDSLEAIRARAERDAIALSLDRFSHNVSLAARELGVSRMTLYRLMAKHSIAPRA